LAIHAHLMHSCKTWPKGWPLNFFFLKNGSKHIFLTKIFFFFKIDNRLRARFWPGQQINPGFWLGRMRFFLSIFSSTRTGPGTGSWVDTPNWSEFYNYGLMLCPFLFVHFTHSYLHA
jgi:putative solute:sodium symporter small subunit